MLLLLLLQPINIGSRFGIAHKLHRLITVIKSLPSPNIYL